MASRVAGEQFDLESRWSGCWQARCRELAGAMGSQAWPSRGVVLLARWRLGWPGDLARNVLAYGDGSAWHYAGGRWVADGVRQVALMELGPTTERAPRSRVARCAQPRASGQLELVG